MNKKEIRDFLDGMEYGEDLPAEAVLDAKRNGIVIVFSGSDYLVEFRGAIEDEVVCYGGGIAHLNKNGLVRDKCDNGEIILRTKAIRAIWDSEGHSWIFKMDIPYKTFEILENGERYCRGIVFSMEDV